MSKEIDKENVRTAIVTFSNKISEGKKANDIGEKLAAFARDKGYDVVDVAVAPKDEAVMEDKLREYIDGKFDLVLTIGGAGLKEYDRLPEVMKRIKDISIPGIPEEIRAVTKKTLFRGKAIVAKKTLIINFPKGNHDLALPAFLAIEPIIPHALKKIDKAIKSV